MSTDWSALKAKRQGKPSTLPLSSVQTPTDPEAPVAAKAEASQEKLFVGSGSEDLRSVDFEIRKVAGRGRGVFAKKPFKAGASLLTTAPLVSVLDSHHFESHCSACFRPCEGVGNTNGFKCSACKAIKYCSRACSTNDWTSHQKECKAFKQYQDPSRPSSSSTPLLPDAPVRALGRLLWAMARSSDVSDAASSMQSLREQLSEKQREEFLKLAMVLSVYVGKSVIEQTCGSPNALLDLCSRFTSNSFSLTDPYLSNIGVSLSPVVALFNHSCEPNAVVVFPTLPSTSTSKHMKVVAIKPIKPGEEVITSYIDLGMTSTSRRSELKERYAFDCVCELCQRSVDGREGKVDWVDPREAVVCSKEGCGTLSWIPILESNGSLTCSACKNVTQVDSLALTEAIQKGKQVLEQADQLQYEDPAKASSTLKVARKDLQAFHLAPSSHPLLSITQTYLSTLLHIQSRDALPTSLLALQGASQVYPAGHPSRAIALSTMAKLTTQRDLNDDNAYWGNTEALTFTLNALNLAIKDVEVAFGSGSQLEKELRVVRQETEEGMKMWEMKERAFRMALRQ